jgi:cell fate regulator YaaT (PSP1 superfamily)
MSGVNIVGVQFRRAGKIYDFDAKELLLQVGDRVVVETERGPSLAEVRRINFLTESERRERDLKPIVRLASHKDLDTSGRLSVEHATSFAKEKIKKLELDMHVINVEIQFGGNKVIIFFSAPGRVDFRELVKELAGGLKTRVELKQVGARDEAKLAGGIGICGREFCCSSFLREFVPVSIKMAKNQNLALNPSKVSGGCGRLLCCLTYEDDTYTELRQKLLPKCTRVKLPDGNFGDVVKGDILNQVMMVETDQGEQIQVPVNDLEVVNVNEGVADDWGDDIDFDSLMGGGDIASLDDSEQIRQRRQSQEPMEKQIDYGETAESNGTASQQGKDQQREGPKNHNKRRDQRRPKPKSGDEAQGSGSEGGGRKRGGRSRSGGRNRRNRNRRPDGQRPPQNQAKNPSKKGGSKPPKGDKGSAGQGSGDSSSS